MSERDPVPATTSVRVFISYAQQSKEHANHVLALTNQLRRQDCIDAWIDQFERQVPEGWRPWMTNQIKRADYALLVCSEQYARHFDGNTPSGIGRGVRWEPQHITQELHDRKLANTRFVPVLLHDTSESTIPLPLKDYTPSRLPTGYETLVRLLTDQHATPAPQIGQHRRLPPLEVPSFAGSVNVTAPPRRWRTPVWAPKHLSLSKAGTSSAEMKTACGWSSTC